MPVCLQSQQDILHLSHLIETIDFITEGKLFMREKHVKTKEYLVISFIVSTKPACNIQLIIFIVLNILSYCARLTC